MTKIKLYPIDTNITDDDIVIGSDADNSDITKNYQMSAIRSYVAAGLSPEVGGTLKITELVDVDLNTTPEDFINSLSPVVTIANYEVVIVVLTSSKYILKLQDTVVGNGETPTTSNDFILITDSFSGTFEYVAKFTPDGTQIGDSQIYDNGLSVSIGSTSPPVTSLLNLTSTTKGFLQPRMTTTQRNAISAPAEGLRIYNTTTKKENFYNGTIWVEIQNDAVNGTLNKVAKFTPDGTHVGDSNITDSGSLVSIVSDTAITGDTTITGTTDIIGATDITGATTVTGATDITGVTTIKSPVASPLSAAFVLLDSASGADPFEIRPSQAGQRNTFIGTNAGKLTTTAAQNNTIVGSYSGDSITTGTNNTFLGYVTGAAVTTATQNTFIGGAAGIVTTGSYNTFLGGNSGYSNTTGASNLFVGYLSGNNNITGSSNTFVGTSSGANNIGADYNTALGNNSGSNLDTGGDNIFLGFNSGRFISGGSVGLTEATNSIFIGSRSKASADAQTNQIVIGYNATGLGNNTTSIGNASTTVTGLFGNIILLNGMGTAPASASATGVAGTIIVTATYIYVCTATDTWKRVAIATW